MKRTTKLLWVGICAFLVISCSSSEPLCENDDVSKVQVESGVVGTGIEQNCDENGL